MGGVAEKLPTEKQMIAGSQFSWQTYHPNRAREVPPLGERKCYARLGRAFNRLGVAREALFHVSLPVSSRILHRLSLIVFRQRPSHGSYRYCPIHGPPVSWCNRFNSNVTNRQRSPTGVSVFYIFSPYPLHLIIPVVVQRIRPSRFRIPIGRNKGRKKRNEERKHEGMISLDVSISLIDSEQVDEYEDASAAYWDLYVSEAKINDENLVDGLGGDADSMTTVVKHSVLPI